MIGKVKLTVDTRPHCTNGWNQTKKFPSCCYAGGHFCDRLRGHKGKCQCVCGATHKKDHGD